MITAIKGMGKAYLKGKKLTGDKRIEQINKIIKKSNKKQDVTEKYIDEVFNIYKEKQ